MIKLKKHSKYIAVAAAVLVLAVAGAYIENHDDAFVIETSTVSDDAFIPNTQTRIDGKININSATAGELMELDGIGEALSQRIIDFRTENGPFLTTESIMLVDGIGSKMYENIKDLICAE